MHSAFLLASWACLSAALPGAFELQYSGRVEATNHPDAPAKEFSLLLTLTDTDPAYFLIEERGAGAWDWPLRFGSISPSDSDATTNPIRVLQIFQETPYPIAVRHPIFSAVDQLMADNEWRAGSTAYICRQIRTVDGRSIADVEVSLDRGRRQTLRIESATGIILSMEERLFLGRGDSFQLTLKLTDRREIPKAEIDATVATAKSLCELQSKLSPHDGAYRHVLNPAELSLASDVIDRLPKGTDDAWGRLTTTIQRDLAVQMRRQAGVEGLSQKYVGQLLPFPKTLQRVDGGEIETSTLTGSTLVLHVWEYNGEKLTEPYGQVGYLDFLNSRREKLGAKVLGVAVDSRFGNAQERRSALRSVNKFREFMNVSYPIVVDDGSLLAQWGDPRAIGAELPLWIVVGHDGKVTLYKPGPFDLKPDEGLRELDAVVVDGLKRQKAAERATPPQ